MRSGDAENVFTLHAARRHNFKQIEMLFWFHSKPNRQVGKDLEHMLNVLLCSFLYANRGTTYTH